MECDGEELLVRFGGCEKEEAGSRKNLIAAAKLEIATKASKDAVANGDLYYFYAEKFGWTPDQCRALTLKEHNALMSRSIEQSRRERSALRKK